MVEKTEMMVIIIMVMDEALIEKWKMDINEITFQITKVIDIDRISIEL